MTRRPITDLTAGVDLLAQLQPHPHRSLDFALPDGYRLLAFEVIPRAGALALVYQGEPVWVCRWRVDGRLAIVTDWRAFWYTHHQALAHLPLAAIFWLANRY